jgi:O-antigen/teichoic acid export membrane protein
VAQSGPRLLGYLYSFASAPVIITGLGLRQFGIWALTGALAQYASLIDLGTGISLARYVAAHHDDRRACGEYMAIASLMTVLIALVLGLASIPAAPLLSHAIGKISTARVQVLLGASVVLLCCSMLMSVITAYPIGHRRMVAPNIGLSIGLTVNFIASVGSIALGAGLQGYALANAGAGIISVAIIAAIVLSVEGPLPLARPGRERTVRFLGYSSRNQIVRLMDLVNYQTDKIVIAFSVGPATAGAYELANRVAIAARQVGVYAASAVDIELTTVMARFGIERVRERYGRLSDVAAACAFPPVFLAMAAAPLLFRAWLWHAPPDAVAVLIGLCAAYTVAVSTSVSYAVAAAAGQPAIIARTSMAAAGANIAFTAALAPFFGIWGVLAGTVVALTGGALAQVVYVHRRFGLPLGKYVNAVLPPARAYALLAVPVVIVSYAGLLLTDDRVTAVLVLGCVSSAYTVACLAWAARAGRLPRSVLRRLPGALTRWLSPAGRTAVSA